MLVDLKSWVSAIYIASLEVLAARWDGSHMILGSSRLENWPSTKAKEKRITLFIVRLVYPMERIALCWASTGVPVVVINTLHNAAYWCTHATTN